MPISPIVLQRRLTEVGRIRIGQLVPAKSGKMRPDKLDRLRYTSADKSLLNQIANLYGGEVREWTPQGGGPKAWEVITDCAQVPVIVPPQSVTQWMEAWSGGGATRRCNGEFEMISGDACMCAAQENFICKPTTRLTVLLRDIESIGVWRLESKGWTSAAELPGMADLLARAGGFIHARLYLKPVRQVTGGETRDFMVPALAVDGVTPAQLLAAGGELGNVSAIAGSAPLAIESKSDAQPYAELALNATTSAEITAIGKQATSAGLTLDEQISAAGKDGSLRDMLNFLWGKFTEIEKAKTAEPADTQDEKVALWTQVMAAAAPLQWTTGRVLEELARFVVSDSAVEPASCTLGELGGFLGHVRGIVTAASVEAEPEAQPALEQPGF